MLVSEQFRSCSSSMWDGVSDPAAAEVHLWVCSDRLFSDQSVFQVCYGLEKQINHLYYSTVNRVSSLWCPKERAMQQYPAIYCKPFILLKPFHSPEFTIPPFFSSLLACIHKGWHEMEDVVSESSGKWTTALLLSKPSGWHWHSKILCHLQDDETWDASADL